MKGYSDSGVLNRHDAVEWRRWWQGQPGVSVQLESIGRGLYRCWWAKSSPAEISRKEELHSKHGNRSQAEEAEFRRLLKL